MRAKLTVERPVRGALTTALLDALIAIGRGAAFLLYWLPTLGRVTAELRTGNVGKGSDDGASHAAA